MVLAYYPSGKKYYRSKALESVVPAASARRGHSNEEYLSLVPLLLSSGLRQDGVIETDLKLRPVFHEFGD